MGKKNKKKKIKKMIWACCGVFPGRVLAGARQFFKFGNFKNSVCKGGSLEIKVYVQRTFFTF